MIDFIGNVEHSGSREAAMEYLRDAWRDRDGRVSCPACGCMAQDWLDAGSSVFIICEDCGREDRRYYAP